MARFISDDIQLTLRNSTDQKRRISLFDSTKTGVSSSEAFDYNFSQSQEFNVSPSPRLLVNEVTVSQGSFSEASSFSSQSFSDNQALVDFLNESGDFDSGVFAVDSDTGDILFFPDEISDIDPKDNLSIQVERGSLDGAYPMANTERILVQSPSDVYSPTVNDAFGFACWIKLDSTGDFGIMAKGADNRDTEREYEFEITSEGRLVITLISQNDTSVFIQRVSSVGDPGIFDGWHHIGFTYDGSGADTGLKLYLDGEEIASDGVSQGSFVGMDSQGGDLALGYFDGGPAPVGYMAQAVFAKGELTDQDFEYLFLTNLDNLPAPLVEDLISYWPLSNLEAPGFDAVDLVKNAGFGGGSSSGQDGTGSAESDEVVNSGVITETYASSSSEHSVDRPISVGGTVSDIEFLNRTLLSTIYDCKGIYIYSQNKLQPLNPIELKKKHVTGNKRDRYFPFVYDPYQRQNAIENFDLFKEVIDSNTRLEFDLEANTTVYMTLYTKSTSTTDRYIGRTTYNDPDVEDIVRPKQQVEWVPDDNRGNPLATFAQLSEVPDKTLRRRLRHFVHRIRQEEDSEEREKIREEEMNSLVGLIKRKSRKKQEEKQKEVPTGEPQLTEEGGQTSKGLKPVQGSGGGAPMGDDEDKFCLFCIVLGVAAFDLFFNRRRRS